jgi:hypothetical protein
MQPCSLIPECHPIHRLRFPICGPANQGLNRWCLAGLWGSARDPGNCEPRSPFSFS